VKLPHYVPLASHLKAEVLKELPHVLSGGSGFAYPPSKVSLNTLTVRREQGLIVTLGHLSEVEPRDGQT
jgi:hypothetical protein